MLDVHQNIETLAQQKGKVLLPNGRRAKRAILWIWIVLALEAICGILSYREYGLYQSIANGVDIPEEAVDANDMIEGIAGILCALAYVVSAITFIMWFKRAYHNLHRSVSHRLAYSEGWATGCWFAPVINLYRSYQIMRELYLATKGWLAKKGMEANLVLSTAALGWWWALWLISVVSVSIANHFIKHADTLDEMIESSIVSMVSSAIILPLALITVKVVRDYANAETLLAEHQEGCAE
ncbi:MAG: DUF4328 domain-containing protein [Kiritimatiellaeota bacterium]|nr:DUF4328 domain-containing protein [Kiritimatiellota bacterium]